MKATTAWPRGTPVPGPVATISSLLQNPTGRNAAMESEAITRSEVIFISCRGRPSLDVVVWTAWMTEPEPRTGAP